MIRYFIYPLILVSVFTAGCATHTNRTVAPVKTLAELRDEQPDIQELEKLQVEEGLDQAMQSYRHFLEEAPKTVMTPEAMRRLADLQIEKEFGIHTSLPDASAADTSPVESDQEFEQHTTAENRMPAIDGETAALPIVPPETDAEIAEPLEAIALYKQLLPVESDQEFEQRTTAENRMQATDGETVALPIVPPEINSEIAGPLEAIALYKQLLAEYPYYEDTDQVLYQMARAYDELGRTDEAMEVMERLIQESPYSEHMDEVQFRRGENFFTRRKYRAAEDAYSAIINMGPDSSYYELALYKLGWTFYKQELYEEALHRYMALFDYKVSTGYDFDQSHEEEDERRIADTFRVVSLSLSNLGDPESVREYFSNFGNRSYEDRVYGNLGAHYLAKMRYDDAAKTYRSFIELYPFHRSAPRFSMNIVETFTRGGFPKLVLESKREFASRYGLQSEYWQHVNPEDSPEVLLYLKTNLKDLATHYHAEYQNEEKTDQKPENYQEALRWYSDYLESFPADDESASINYRLADLHFEEGDFGEAARQYARTAYEYEPHDQSAAAGYAAVHSYRRQLDIIGEDQREAVRKDTVASSFQFADTFPEHEQAAPVLGAAADDLYEMKEYRTAVDAARRVIDNYPGSDPDLRRSAWLVAAHGSFELGEYPEAENAYIQVLAVTPEDDESHTGLIENLAASIYKQGEFANEAEDYRAAADHFLRVRTSAPTSSICASAVYDAGAALMRLQNWPEAVSVFDTFRSEYPEHELKIEATRQIAYAYREDGQLLPAAGEYEFLASQSEDPALRSEALLVAGDLYEQSDTLDRALAVYILYVKDFPDPVETALETRNKIAGIYKAENEQSLYLQELEQIVSIDAEAGSQRTGRTRTLAARASLVLAEQLFESYVAIELRQPFEASLEEKQQSMSQTIEAMNRLVEYEIAEITTAATYYMAETYYNFSLSLMESERPDDLTPDELDAFEMNLDETAFPFEEKAIDVHEKNMEILHAGVFNDWTGKSLDRLTDLMPGRYAKKEMSSDYLGQIDRYVYRSPAAQDSLPTSDDTGTMTDGSIQATQPEPMAANEWRSTK